MKTIVMERNFDYRVSPQTMIAYKGGKEYRRVPEAHVEAIVAAGAGRIVRADRDAAFEGSFRRARQR